MLSALEIAMQIARIAILIGQLWMIERTCTLHRKPYKLKMREERREGGGYGKITIPRAS